MIAEVNLGRNEFQSNIADEGRAQLNQNEANNMLGGISNMENILVQVINAKFRNSTALKQASDRTAISDLEFVYNLRET
jgi:Mg2+/Co2+ transporter CorB